MDKAQYTIGFSNLSEQIPFSVTVRKGLEAAAAQYPDLKLIVRDNDLNSDKARSNVEEFCRLPVDLAMIYHIDEHTGMSLGTTLMTHKIPVIAIDIPIRWTVFFGINNEKAGFLAGKALGQWINENWAGKVDKVLAITEQRVSSTVGVRVESALKGLASQVEYTDDAVFYVDGGSDRRQAERVTSVVLDRWADLHNIAIIGYNDDSALGALDAARSLRRVADIAVIGQGANLAPEEFKKSDTRFIASTAYYPERYGNQLIDLALRMLQGERVPRENLIDPAIVTARQFMPQR
ncbi:MAG: substrate-binding domain-containing protein [Chloroflexota bacterium]